MQNEKLKLHAACDECRARKLKCSGDSPMCARCVRENIQCRYSPQKPMGRPRKRRREDVFTTEPPTENVSTFVAPVHGDSGYISPELHDFSAYGGAQSQSDHSNGVLPTSLPETSLPGHFEISDLDFAVDQIGPAMDESLWHQPFPDPDIDTGITAATSDQTQAQPQFPSPVETRTTSVGPCTCFSIMFLAISDLQSLNNTSYPAAVPHLRSAMKTAAEIINCERCPKEAFSAIQNVQSSTAILSALAERFHKVLYEINREASELESEQRRKTITMGDMSAQNMHLHTGTPDCPMKFDVQLEPSDWKKYAKQALKREVFGNPQSTTNTSLMGLVEAMAKRQHAWHADKSFHTEERVRMFGLQEKCMEPGETATCQRMVHQIRRMVEAIDWTD